MPFLSARKNSFRLILFCIFFCAVIFIAFFPCLKADFVNWDDNVHLTENIVVNAVAWEGLGANTFYDIFRQRVNKTYQPLTILSYAIEYYFFRDQPFIYHLNNVLLHVLVSLAVFFFFLRLGLNSFWAALGALFFALHPTKVESVAWITARKDVLYGLWYMLALHAYLSYIDSRKKIWYLLALFLGLLSILSKAMALSLPLILILMDWFKGRKVCWRIFAEKIPFFLMIGAITFITYISFARNPIYDYQGSLLLWIWCFAFYLKIFAFPVLLLPIYARPQIIAFSDPQFFLSVMCFLLVLFSLFVLRRRKQILFGFGFYFLSIFFLFRFDLSDAHFVADRFLYLPSAGLSFVVFFFFQQVCAHWQKRSKSIQTVVVVFILAVLVFFGIKTFLQCQVWKNNVTLWEYQLKYNQDHPTPFNNLAVGFDIKGYREQSLEDFEQLRAWVKEDPYYLLMHLKDHTHPSEIENMAVRRIWLLRRAIELDPSFSDALFNLGLIYSNLGKTDQAISLLERSLRSNPGSYRTYRELANLLAEQGDDRKAIMLYLGILGLPDAHREPNTYMLLIRDLNDIIRSKESEDPLTAELYREARQKTLDFYRSWIARKGPRKSDALNLAWIYEDMGGYFSSMVLYQELLKQKPKDVETMHMLGSLCYEIGEFDQALEVYQRLKIITPRDENVYLNIGAIYNRKGQFQKAIDYYQQALVINPYYRKAYFNLGYVYENLDQNKQAIDHYKRLLEIFPQHAEAYYNIANIYAKIRQLPDAVLFYQKALDIRPDHLNALINLSIVAFFARDFNISFQSVERARALGYRPPEKFLQALEMAVGGEELKLPRSSVQEFMQELFGVEEK